MRAKYWLADPTIPTDSSTSWLTSHGWQIIAAIVLAVVAIAVYKALPKWLFLIIATIVGAISLGVAFK